MRIAKIPAEIVEAKVLESLRSRMDPATRRVYLRWKQMMREIGVCRQRIADAVKSLKDFLGTDPTKDLFYSVSRGLSTQI